MTWFDYSLMAAILGGAGWILYKALFQDGKVQCPGCDSDSCSIKKIQDKS